MIPALTDYLILELTTQLPGPYCAMLLADLGASVIKVEPPGGDPLRRFPPAFASVNRGKRNIVIDLKKDAGGEVMRRLVSRADVVLEGFRPGVAGRLGVDYPSVKHLNPSVVYCAISGFGQEGPYRNRAGHDINYLAIGGLLGRGDPPAVPPVLISDLSSGLYAALAVSAALMHRTATGEGRFIDLSMTDCILSWMALDIATAAQNPDAAREPFLGSIPHYGVFETSDGRHISLGIVLEDHFWTRLCDVLGLEDWRDWSSEKRLNRAAAIQEKLQDVFATDSCREWDRRLREADVPCAPIYNLDELPDDPYIQYRNPFYSLEASDRSESRQVKAPYRTDAPVAEAPLPPPLPGEHTRSVLSDSGFEDDEIDRLIRQGAVHESRLGEK
ncbi:MAG: CaiB/BaiF CoA-transferase family protein [Gemmatimonadetes bacterium]|nr:CaiB/BaiF CoA-transferase family protein [Gemmatimonadota bacterium]